MLPSHGLNNSSSPLQPLASHACMTPSEESTATLGESDWTIESGGDGISTRFPDLAPGKAYGTTSGAVDGEVGMWAVNDNVSRARRRAAAPR